MNAAIAPLIEQAAAKYNEAKAILLDTKATAEDITKALKIRDEADGLKARASTLKQIELAAEGIEIERKTPIIDPGATGEKFAHWGSFLKAVAKISSSKGAAIDSRLKFFNDPDETDADDGAGRKGQKDMSGGSLAGGGALIPIENYDQLMAVASPLTIIRKRATLIRMTRRQINIPLVDQSQVAAGQPAFFGGIQVFWQEEASQGTVSDPKFRRATLTANKMIGYTRVSNELLGDAEISLADFLGGAMGFPGAIAWYEDYAFLRGSGAGQPQGIINAPATIATTRATAGTIKYDDLVNMMASFLGQKPVWIATQALKKTLMLMAGPTATNYAGYYLWGNASTGVPDTLLGYPIYFTDKQPAVGTIGDIVLADPTYYLMGDRQATTVEATPYEKFQFDQTSFRVTHRVDGQPWLNSPITLSDGATTVSPFVQVAT